MDTYIQTLSSLLVDWQQIAISNPNYSVVLSLVGVLIGLLLVNFLKKNEVGSLKQQLIEEKQALEQIAKKREELIVAQRNDAQTITGFQQQQENSAKELQKSNAIHTELKKKYDLQFQSLQEQETELDNLKSTINGKTDEIKQLQAEVDQQKALINQQSDDLKNSVNKVKQSTEFDIVKQQLHQLKSELDVKNEQIEQYETTNQPFSKDDSSSSEQTNQQHAQQLADFNKKLKLLLLQSSTQEGKQNRVYNGAGSGLFDKVLNIFSSDTLISEKEEDNADGKSEDGDVWLQHQKILDQVINQFSNQPDEIEHPEIITENEIAVEDKVIVEDEVVLENKNDEKSSIITKNIPPEIAEKFKEMTEKTDQFQEKLKGLYQKISS